MTAWMRKAAGTVAHSHQPGPAGARGGGGGGDDCGVAGAALSSPPTAPASFTAQSPISRSTILLWNIMTHDRCFHWGIYSHVCSLCFVRDNLTVTCIELFDVELCIMQSFVSLLLSGLCGCVGLCFSQLNSFRANTCSGLVRRRFTEKNKNVEPKYPHCKHNLYPPRHQMDMCKRRLRRAVCKNENSKRKVFEKE